MLLAGPAANLVLGALALSLSGGHGLEPYAWLSVVIGFVTLLPIPSRGRPSAGLLLWKLRDRAWAGRMRALLLLAREAEEGVLPEDWSPRLLEEAVAIADESPQTVLAHALAYSSAFYRGAPDPGRFLEICLHYSGTAGPAWREGLMSDATVWQARQRGRPDLAERWLADMPSKPLLPWMRTRAEAALLEARGDTRGALAKLEEVERGIRAAPEGPGREVQLTLLARWRAEVGQAPRGAESSAK